jgi:hypothetical protein
LKLRSRAHRKRRLRDGGARHPGRRTDWPRAGVEFGPEIEADCTGNLYCKSLRAWDLALTLNQNEPKQLFGAILTIWPQILGFWVDFGGFAVTGGGAATPWMGIFQVDLVLRSKNRAFLAIFRILVSRRHCAKSEAVREWECERRNGHDKRDGGARALSTVARAWCKENWPNKYFRRA